MSESTEEQFNRRSRIAAMQEMASAISFDLTDLTTVMTHKLGNIKKGLEQGREKELVLKDIDPLEQALARLSKIAKGMRSLGLMGDEESAETLALKDLIQPVSDLVAPWFKTAKVDFRIETVPVLQIRCKTSQVSQSLINLLNNSLDAQQEQKDAWTTLDFKVTGSSPSRLQISVTDSGVLSPENAEHVMEPFFSTKPKGKGLGLGLNVVKSVAEAHSGRLFLDTTSRSTRFVFEIPLF